MKNNWFDRVILALAVATLTFSPPAVTAQPVTLLNYLSESPVLGDFATRGIYVTNYPGTSIDTVTLSMGRGGLITGNFTITLQARFNTFDGPLVAESSVIAFLGNPPTNVVFPMLKDLASNPPVQYGTTLCFSITVTQGGMAHAAYIGTVGVLDVDYPDATDPCPLVVQTIDTTPPLSTFRRDGMEIKITGDAHAADLSVRPVQSLIHLTGAANIAGHISTINDPTLNGRSDLKLFITNNRAGLPHNRSMAVYYSSNRWRIFNEDLSPMPAGLRINVVAIKPGVGVFNHNSSPTILDTNFTILDHPFLNGNPDARLVISRDWSVGNSYNANPTGVWYNSGPQRWTVFNPSVVPMPANTNFNIHADLNGAHSFTHLTNAGNLVPGGTLSRLDHPKLNLNPNAKITVTHDWRGVYVDSPLGVKYENGRWHVLREDGMNLAPNLRFNILIGEPNTASPPLEIANTGSQITLWNHHPLGIIQHSGNLQPPWGPFLTSGNPHTFTAISPRDFFRLFLHPDPAVWSIGARIIRRDSPTAGRVRILAEIRNLGGSYLSSPGLQILSLSERLPGGDTTILAQQDFTSLATGANLSLTIEREWSSVIEPPREYILSITYSPSIASDGIPTNDDCHLQNNSRTLIGSEIHTLFN